MAQQQKVGHLIIADTRVFVNFGRNPNPSDILGTVLLDEGRIIEGMDEAHTRNIRIMSYSSNGHQGGIVQIN